MPHPIIFTILPEFPVSAQAFMETLHDGTIAIFDLRIADYYDVPPAPTALGSVPIRDSLFRPAVGGHYVHPANRRKVPELKDEPSTPANN